MLFGPARRSHHQPAATNETGTQQIRYRAHLSDGIVESLEIGEIVPVIDPPPTNRRNPSIDPLGKRQSRESHDATLLK